MKLRFEPYEYTDQGHRPEQNDRALVELAHHGSLLVAVMDGVGSYMSGDVAAAAVAEELRRQARQHPADVEDIPLTVLDHALHTAVKDMAGQPGATTCTALVLNPDGRAAIAHIGDCAAFRLRGGRIVPLTKPDRHDRHTLTHALHGHPEATWRASTRWKSWLLEHTQPGDVYLLASDGCYEAAPAQLLEGMLGAEELWAGENVAERLVKWSLVRGTTDNSTAIVVRVREA